MLVASDLTTRIGGGVIMATLDGKFIRERALDAALHHAEPTCDARGQVPRCSRCGQECSPV